MWPACVVTKDPGSQRARPGRRTARSGRRSALAPRSRRRGRSTRRRAASTRPRAGARAAEACVVRVLVTSSRSSQYLTVRSVRISLFRESVKIRRMSADDPSAHERSRPSASSRPPAGSSCSEGAHGLRMASVAAEAGVSKALVHYYFATRQELLRERVRVLRAALARRRRRRARPTPDRRAQSSSARCSRASSRTCRSASSARSGTRSGASLTLGRRAAPARGALRTAPGSTGSSG